MRALHPVHHAARSGRARVLTRTLRTLTYFRRHVHLLVCIFVAAGCQNDELEISTTQRELGEINSDALDLNVQLAPGILREVNESTRVITGRASAGVGTITLRTGPQASQSIAIELSNVHPDAQLTARRVRAITSAETLGALCTQSDSPLDVNCITTPDNASCQSGEVSRARATRATFTLALTPCMEATYEIKIPTVDSVDTLSFVVVGSLKTPDTIGEIHAAEIAAGQQHDFYLLLGDVLEKKGNGFISDLEDQLDALDTVAILTPGEEEIGDDSGQYYERRFGAFEYRWTIKNTQFVTLYSAQQQLNARALGSLRSSLRAMQTEDQQWRVTNAITLEDGEARALPAFAITHTPLFDPSGPRNAGIKSRLEASQAASLLSNAGVHTLFAGHIIDNAHVTTTSPNLLLTTSQHTRSNQDLGRYRRVTISGEERTGSIPVGASFMTVETLPLP